MRKFIKKLSLILLLLMSTALVAQAKSRITLAGATDLDLAAYVLPNITVNYTEDGASMSQDINAGATLGINADAGTLVSYEVTFNDDEYTFLKWLQPSGDPYTITTVIDTTALPNIIYKAEFLAPLDTTIYTPLSLKLLKHENLEITAPTDYTLSGKYKLGGVEKQFSVTDATQTVRVDVDSLVWDINSNESHTSSDTRSVFTGWTGALNPSKIATAQSFTMPNTDQTLGINTETQYKLTVNLVTLDPDSTAEAFDVFTDIGYTGAPIDSDTALNVSQSYKRGTLLKKDYASTQYMWVHKDETPTIEAYVDSAYAFVAWTGDATNDDLAATMPTMNAPKTITGTFVRQYQVTVESPSKLEITGLYCTTKTGFGTTSAKAFDVANGTKQTLTVDYNSQITGLKVVQSGTTTRGVNEYITDDSRQVALAWVKDSIGITDIDQMDHTSASGESTNTGIKNDGSISVEVANQVYYEPSFTLNGAANTSDDYGQLDAKYIGATHNTDNIENNVITSGVVSNQDAPAYYWLEKDSVHQFTPSAQTGFAYIGKGTSAPFDLTAPFDTTATSKIAETFHFVETLSIILDPEGQGSIMASYYQGGICDTTSWNSTLDTISVDKNSKVELWFKNNLGSTERFVFTSWNPTFTGSEAINDVAVQNGAYFTTEKDATIKVNATQQYLLVVDSVTASRSGAPDNYLKIDYEGTALGADLRDTTVTISTHTDAAFRTNDTVWVNDSANVKIDAMESTSPLYAFTQYKQDGSDVGTLGVDSLGAFFMTATTNIEAHYIIQSYLTIVSPDSSKITLTDYYDGGSSKTGLSLTDGDSPISVDEGKAAKIKWESTLGAGAHEKNQLKEWLLIQATDTLAGYFGADSISTPADFDMPSGSTTLTAVLSAQWQMDIAATTNGLIRVDYITNGTPSTSYDRVARTIWVDKGTYPTVTAIADNDYTFGEWAADTDAATTDFAPTFNEIPTAADMPLNPINKDAATLDYPMNGYTYVSANFYEYYDLSVNTDLLPKNAQIKVKYKLGYKWYTRVFDETTTADENTVRVNGNSYWSATALPVNSKTAIGYDFDQWYGALSGGEPVGYTDVIEYPAAGQANCVQMTCDMSVGAKWAIPSRTVTFDAFNNGQVNFTYWFAGHKTDVVVDANSTKRTYAIDLNDSIIIKATPEQYFEFGSWVGDVLPADATNDSISIKNITENITLGVNFPSTTRILTVDKLEAGSIKVEYKLDGKDSVVTITPLDENRTVRTDLNNSATVTIVDVKDGYLFESWTGAASGITTTPTNITMDADKSIGATFKSNARTLTVEAPKVGAIKVTYDGYDSEGKSATGLVANVTPESGTRTFIVTKGSTPSVEAASATNATFKEWVNEKGAMVSTDNPYTLAAFDADTTIAAVYLIDTHTLTLSGANGTVRVDYIKGGDAKTEVYTTPIEVDADTEVTLTALPNNNFNFLNWGTDLVGVNDVTTKFLMSEDKTIKATFINDSHVLTVEAPINGTITINYKGFNTDGSQRGPVTETINENSGNQRFLVQKLTDVTVTRKANEHFELGAWIGDGASTVNMSKDMFIGSEFVSLKVSLTLEASSRSAIRINYMQDGALKPEVTLNPGQTLNGIDKGSKVTVFATTDNDEFDFYQWTGALQGDKNLPATLFMDDDKTIGTHYIEDSRILTVEAPINGSITVTYEGFDNDGKPATSKTTIEVNANSGNQRFAVQEGTGVTATRKADLNYVLDAWTGDGADNFTMDTDKVIGATFKVDKVTLTNSGNGPIRVEFLKDGVAQTRFFNPGQTITDIDKGTEITVTATFDNDDLDFFQWTDALAGNKETSAKFYMDANKSIGAQYIVDSHVLTVEAPVNGSIEITYFGFDNDGEPMTAATTATINAQSGNQRFVTQRNSKVAVSQVADLNYTFGSWSANVVADEVAMTEDQTINATFILNTFDLTVNIAGDGKVSVDYIQGGVAKNTVLAATGVVADVDAATEVTVTAIENGTDSDFFTWTDALAGNNNTSATFYMDVAKTIGAKFVNDARVLNVEAPINGAINIEYLGFDNDGEPMTAATTATINAQSGNQRFVTQRNSKVAVSQVADLNYTFGSWSANVVADEVAMTEDQTINATFILNTFDLTVNIAGDGKVSVDYIQGGVAKNTVLAATGVVADVDAATEVTVTAIENGTDSDFFTWTDALAGNNNTSATFYMDAAKTIGAKFVNDARVLNVEAPINGAINIEYLGFDNDGEPMTAATTATINAQSGNQRFVTQRNSKVAVSQVADLNYTFGSWSANVVADEVAMTEDQTINATFILNTFDLTVNIAGDGKVSVDYIQGGVAKNTVLAATGVVANVDAATEVTVTAIENGTETDFFTWTDALAGNNNTSATFYMDAAKTIGAEFVNDARMLTVNAPVNGTITVEYKGFDNDGQPMTTATVATINAQSGNQYFTVQRGTDVIVSTTADLNYKFGAWSANVTAGKVTMTNDETINATFVLDKYELKVNIADAGFGKVRVEYTSFEVAKDTIVDATATTIDAIDVKSEVTVTAIKGDDYDFLGWDGDLLGIDYNTTKFIMNRDKEITAEFRLRTMNLRVVNPINGTIKIDYVLHGNDETATIADDSKVVNFTADINSNVKVTPVASPNPGYYIGDVIVNDAKIASSRQSTPGVDATPAATYNFNTEEIDNILEVIFNATVYTVTFNEDGGSAVADFNYTIEDYIEFEVTDRTHEDVFYEFAGWKDDATGDITTELNSETGNKTYTAQWNRVARELTLIRLWSHTLAVSNPLQRPEVTSATYKWFKDGNELVGYGNKAYITFAEPNVPNGTYKVEIYVGTHAPIVLETTIVDYDLRVYPTTTRAGQTINIVTNDMTIEREDVRVYHLDGREVNAEVVQTNEGFQVTGLKVTGTYILRVEESEGQKASSHKILVIE